MTITITEKRRFPRKVMKEAAKVLDKDTGQLIGVLEDVSRGGFSLLTDLKIRLSELRHITLVLPGPQKSTHKVSLSAECIWCQSGSQQSEHPRDYEAGFQLKEIEEQDAVALNYFIRDY